MSQQLDTLLIACTIVHLITCSILSCRGCLSYTSSTCRRPVFDTVPAIRHHSHHFLAYRVCTHIAKALQTCSKAIQAAVKTYNAAVLALDPPHPTVDWSKVSHYSLLEEFALLHDENDNVHAKPWSLLHAREVMCKAR